MGSDKKQDLLKNGIIIGKKANKTTPSPTWKLGFQHPNFSMNNPVSARKIGANLWEVEPQFNFSKDGGDRPTHHRRRRHGSRGKEGVEISDQLDEEPPDSHPQPPEIETGVRRKIREFLSLHHLSVGKHDQDAQNVSSTSCSSSMEMTPYVRASPSGYTIKPSTHLLKVLNRIWNLEEQHSSNVALIKSLKRDLEISRAQIKTLLQETKRARQEIDELKKSTHERVGSTTDELTREKKTRALLEGLCDEFAKGIRDYEQKARFLQQNREKKDRIVSKNGPDRLILHLSEAWLDERMQMKSVSDNLRFEIEMFLETKKKESCGFGVEDDEILEKRQESRPVGATEPSSQLASKMTDPGPGATEPSSESVSRMASRGTGAAEPSSRPARAGLKQNTLMAKLLEARLESQLSKSRTIRR